MYIRVRVTAGARKERVVREDADTFYITVKEPAERNLANGRIKEILASELKVPPRSVRLLTGHHSSSKLYVVDV
jgi:uncharacterized protein YggU (UPF0235/DUF167 family)